MCIVITLYVIFTWWIFNFFVQKYQIIIRSISGSNINSFSEDFILDISFSKIITSYDPLYLLIHQIQQFSLNIPTVRKIILFFIRRDWLSISDNFQRKSLIFQYSKWHHQIEIIHLSTSLSPIIRYMSSPENLQNVGKKKETRLYTGDKLMCQRRVCIDVEFVSAAHQSKCVQRSRMIRWWLHNEDRHWIVCPVFQCCGIIFSMISQSSTICILINRILMIDFLCQRLYGLQWVLRILCRWTLVLLWKNFVCKNTNVTYIVVIGVPMIVTGKIIHRLRLAKMLLFLKWWNFGIHEIIFWIWEEMKRRIT